MKRYIVFCIFIFSQTGFGQDLSFDNDPYYEFEDFGLKGNGNCGSGRTAGIVPESPFGYDFSPSCAAHDLCYDTCGQPKKICDEHFRGDMNGVCRTRFGEFDPQRYTCLGVAQTYWEAVNTLGEDSYKEAQEEACK
jgi:hypothetical protein